LPRRPQRAVPQDVRHLSYGQVRSPRSAGRRRLPDLSSSARAGGRGAAAGVLELSPEFARAASAKRASKLPAVSSRSRAAAGPATADLRFVPPEHPTPLSGVQPMQRLPHLRVSLTPGSRRFSFFLSTFSQLSPVAMWFRLRAPLL